MFSFLGRFFDWLAMRCKTSVLSIKYDAAVHDLKARRLAIKKAIHKNFESMYSLSDMIDNATLRLVSNQKTAAGAADFYLDDPQSNYAGKHRQEGVLALGKASELSQKIEGWTKLRGDLQVTQLSLQRADMEIEERVSFLQLEKPRSLAMLKAAYYESSVYKRAINEADLDPQADEHLNLLRQYKNQQKAWQATKQFMNIDPTEPYRRRADGSSFDSPSDEFEKTLRRRQAGRSKVVDLVVRGE